MHTVVYEDHDRSYIDVGLKYVNNDACFPSLIIVGQIISTIQSGQYDLSKFAVLMSQTGGGCRATNYINFIRRALAKIGHPEIPVISLNLSKLETNPGFNFSAKLVQHGIYAIVFGDIFMRCVYATRPYEAVPGTTDAVHEKWKKRVIDFITQDKIISHAKYNRMCREIIEEFDNIERVDVVKPKVGIVGEILVKFAPVANNHLVELLEAEGAEVVVPDFIDFFQYCFYNQNFKHENLGMSKFSAVKSNVAIWGVELLRKEARKAFAKSKHFTPPAQIAKTADDAKDVVSLGNQTGEGWFLAGEIVELIHMGCSNIVCCQPFGCLPNHIVGKGVIKKVRATYPEANIVAIDFDPGASEVNQLNRIKLLLSAANKKLKNSEANNG